MEKSDILYIPDEDGIEVEFGVVAIFEIDGKNYMFLVQIDSEDDDIYAFQYEEDGDDVILHAIDEDSEKWDIIEEIFTKWQTEEE